MNKEQKRILKSSIRDSILKKCKESKSYSKDEIERIRKALNRVVG